MSTPILMPCAEPSMRVGRVMRWLRREGDFVETGEPVAEISANRTTMDVEAPSTGVLVRILAEAGGDEIAVDSSIGLIEPGPAPHRSNATDAKAADRPGRTPVSPRARRLAHEAGIDLSQIAGSGPNGRVVESDVHAALAARAREVHPLRDAAASVEAKKTVEIVAEPGGAGARPCGHAGASRAAGSS